jgi:hypothetical protein
MIYRRFLGQVSDPQKAIQILAYASKHDLKEMANLAAKHTTSLSLDDAFGALPGEAGKHFLKWVNPFRFILRNSNITQLSFQGQIS